MLLLRPLDALVHKEVHVPGLQPVLHLPGLPQPSLLGGLVLPNSEALGFVREVFFSSHSTAPVPGGPRTRAPSRQEPDHGLNYVIFQVVAADHIIGKHYRG